MDIPRALVVALAAVLVWTAGSAAAPGPQELTITASDGTQLACGLVLPDGTPPSGGWPGLLLFHGLGQTHSVAETAATEVFAPAGYASLACDARGVGGSGGSFDLDGPRATQDVRELFDWLAARPDVSDTKIGAFGISLGGAAVWNAAAAGVPFRAIVPAISWTDLASALAPAGVPKTGLLAALEQAVPTQRWDPELAAARDALLAGTVTAQVRDDAAQRSSRSRLASLHVPALILQGRRDYLFDLGQAAAAYKALQGPKKLYIGDLGHTPAGNPTAELPYYVGEALTWFDRYLKGAAPRAGESGVEIADEPWDGGTTSYVGLPLTQAASVALPGSSVLGPGVRVSRSATLTGGPHETFGNGAVVVRYAGARGWPRLVASVSVAGSRTPITLGAVRITKPAGTATIHLLDEVVNVPRGKRLVVTVGASSANGLFAGEPPAGATITLGRMTLTLPFLRAKQR